MSYTEGMTSRLPPSDTKQWTHCRHSTSLPFPTVAPTGAACSVSHRQSFNKELKLELTYQDPSHTAHKLTHIFWALLDCENMPDVRMYRQIRRELVSVIVLDTPFVHSAYRKLRPERQEYYTPLEHWRMHCTSAVSSAGMSCLHTNIFPCRRILL
jgi:hypothetical protein